MNYNAGKGPGLLAYNVTKTTYEYLMRLVDLGIIEGKLGEMKLSPQIAEIAEALHVVAAGGSVKIEVTARGSPDIVQELRNRLDESTRDANEINGKSGYDLTLLP